MGLKVIIWDVQHGSSTYIKTPGGVHIVIDLGTGRLDSGQEFSPLCYLRNKYNVRQVDWVIITHPHSDHLQDIRNWDIVSPRVLSRPKHLTEKEIWDGNRNADRELIERYLELNRRYNRRISDDENPALAENNGGVDIKTFIPTECGRSNLNNHSIVTVITYAGAKIVVPGDNEAASWHELLEMDEFRKAIAGTDIFVASHHGRESGYCADLFDVFRPKLTIVSDGPAGDTSVTHKYSSVSTGLPVKTRGARFSETRKCVTTRRDGWILIEIEPTKGGSGDISVTVGKG